MAWVKLTGYTDYGSKLLCLDLVPDNNDDFLCEWTVLIFLLLQTLYLR